MVDKYKKVLSRPAAYILAAVVLLFCINIIANLVLTKYEFDLTEDNIFTLSKGTKNILAKQEEPITFRFFFSNKISNGIPSLKSYAARIRGFLEEYEDMSNGKISIEYIDPEPFSDDEDLAVSYGLKGVKIDDAGTKIYFGLVATNSVDDSRTIPFFDFNREKFLEYDISRIVYDLSNAKRITIGLLSTVELGGQNFMGIPGMPGSSDTVVLQQIKQIFDVKNIDSKASSLPSGIDVLMIVQPKDFSDEMLYSIDQYVMAGGRVLVFADPNMEHPNGVSKNDSEFSGNFNRLFASWGVKINPNEFVGDRLAARRVNSDSEEKGYVDYIAWLNLRDENLNKEELSTSMLQVINMATPGAIEVLEGVGTEVIPLIKSSKRSMKISDAEVRGPGNPNPNKLLSNFVSSNQEFILGVRIQGNAHSAFRQDDAIVSNKNSYIAQSQLPVNVIIFADTDMLTDDIWVEKMNLQGYTVLKPNADNGSLVVNSLDQLSGSDDLISLRGRGTADRPFTVVENIKHSAEERYLSKEKELSARLSETENKLAALKEQSKQGNALFLKAEQEQEIKRFSDQMVSIRKELREVQRDLRKDIERLGSVLKFINIALVPFIIIGFAIYVHIYRNRRRGI